MSAVQAEDQRVRGTIQDLVYQSDDNVRTPNVSFAFTCRSKMRYGEEFEISLEVTKEGMRVISECIKEDLERVPLYEVVGPAKQFSHEVSVCYNNFLVEA